MVGLPKLSGKPVSQLNYTWSGMVVYLHKQSQSYLILLFLKYVWRLEQRRISILHCLPNFPLITSFLSMEDLVIQKFCLLISMNVFMSIYLTITTQFLFDYFISLYGESVVQMYSAILF